MRLIELPFFCMELVLLFVRFDAIRKRRACNYTRACEDLAQCAWRGAECFVGLCMMGTTTVGLFLSSVSFKRVHP